MRRLQVRKDNQESDMKDIVFETDASYLDWVDYEGQQVQQTWNELDCRQFVINKSGRV
jgi:hypothetical protein